MTDAPINDNFPLIYLDEDGVLTEAGEQYIAGALELLGEAVLRNTVAHGFDMSRPFSEDVALIHSEASEALEEWRDGQPLDAVWYSKKVTHPLYGKVEVAAPEFADDGAMNKPEGVPAEFADIIIRVAQSARQHGMQLGRRVVQKNRYNRSRPLRHGKIA